MAARSVASLSATVWVVQSDAKREGAVSRLQWSRSSPASFSLARSSAPTSPSEAQREIFVFARIARRAAQISSICRGVCPRPDVTMPSRTTPLRAASSAACTQAAVPTQSYDGQFVPQCADCAHHWQFSPQRPLRALMMAQTSKSFGRKRAVTRCAASQSSSCAAARQAERTSAAAIGFPARTADSNSAMFIFGRVL